MSDEWAWTDYLGEVVGKLFLLENCGQQSSLCIIALAWVRLCRIRNDLAKVCRGIWECPDHLNVSGR